MTGIDWASLGGKARDIARTFRLVWSACRSFTALWLALLVVQGLLPVATVQLTKRLVDGLTAAMGAGDPSWARFAPVLTVAGLMALILVLTQVLQLLIEWTRTLQSELIQDHIAGLVHDKSVAVDMGFYELSEFHDHLHRARADATNRPLAMLEGAGSALQNGVTLVAMAAVLLPYGWWLPPALLLSTLPALVVVIRASRRYHAWWNAETISRRRIQYLDLLLTNPHHAGELRLFGLGPHFRRAYQAAREKFRTDRLALLAQQYRARFGAEVLALGVSGAAVLWMLYRAFLGMVTLGDLALFFQAFQRGQGLVRTLLGNLGQIYTDSLYIGNLFEFLGLESRVIDRPDAVPAPRRLDSGIRFDNVTFSYPGRRAPSLRNFSAFVPAGRIVALVGENGAGKTTALKLVSRFYDPQSGRVELDGVDVRRLSLASLRRSLTFMFQTPGMYQLTARDNILLGDIEAPDSASRIERAVWSAGADGIIRRLPNGYDSQLGRWFPGGSELSGGEWQRLALARAFMRDTPIMLLDEPTSAMDSWAEADWFDRLRTLASGRTVILVTHRLTIAMRADLVYVLQGGEVVESGSHDELLAIDGRYARSWRAQTRSSPGEPALQVVST